MTKHLKNTNAIGYAFAHPMRVLIHVCNAKKTMGSGIAKEVRERSPSAFRNYVNDCRLGHVTFSNKGDVCNLVAQEFYGNDGRKYLNYGALAQCLQELRDVLDTELEKAEIVLPYKMGAERSGGSWDVVLELVEWYFQEYQITVCEL